MKLLKNRFRLFKELSKYIWENKKLWLAPAAVVMFLLGFLISTAGTSSIPIFVYPVV